MFNDNKNFYPTPEAIVFQLLDKLYTDDKNKFYSCKYILEPEAGKGDMIEAYYNYCTNKKVEIYEKINSKETDVRKKIYYNKDKILAEVKKGVKFDCVEIDNTLSNILRGKNFNVIWDSYLTFNPPRFYDLILQNVPFSEGVHHLLKSIEIQERIGGCVLAIINAETIKNPYSKERKLLIEKLNTYKADIEYIQNAFTDAERKTDVEVALLYINIPMKNTESMFEKDFKRTYTDIDLNDYNALIPKMNKLERMVLEFRTCRDSIIKLYEEKIRIEKLFKGLNINQTIGIVDKNDITNCGRVLSVNDFIEKINLKYWNMFIEEIDFKSKLPSNLKNTFTYNIERQKDIEFNIENARYFSESLMIAIPDNYEKTVADVFDTLTIKHNYSESSYNTNIHLFTGWKTNKICKIVGKNIIPCHLQNGGYSLPDVLIDLNVIFNNLSGTKYIIDTQEIREKIKNCEKNINTEHFILDSYKKGTLHIKYKNQELLKKFNYLACKGHNVLPPDFGKKKYKDMTEEEKELIKFFNFEPVEYDNIVLTGNTNYIPLQLN